MFEDAVFALTLEQLADEIAARPAPPPNPLVTDSWIARSAMQKAIRRGMADLALRAAATLIALDRRTLWRRLLVTALEDLGPGEIDTTARIVAAIRDHRWRAGVGGDWAVAAELVQRACEGSRCQAANDLWNVARNDPAVDTFKATLCEADLKDVLTCLADGGRPVEERAAVVLLAMGEDAGPTSPQHVQPDPAAVFEVIGSHPQRAHVAVVYKEAHRLSRLALAPFGLLLWPESALIQVRPVKDDLLLPVRWSGDIPAFALDQYTRGGVAAVRRYVRTSTAWGAFAARHEIASADHAKAAGELLFRVEGAAVTRRRDWGVGNRLYERSSTLGCFMSAAVVPEGMALIAREGALIDKLRLGLQDLIA